MTDRTGGDLEVLRLRPELTADPAFESALKTRAEELTAFQHRGVARVRGISRLPAPDGRLAVVSESVRGWRLSEVLQAAEQEEHLIHTSTVLFLLRQIASAGAALQAAGSGIVHGALGPERVLLTPDRRVIVVEYVLGAALAHLPAHSADRMWKDLRIAVPADEGRGRFTANTDVLQLGIIALSLVHNRLLRRDEYPGRLTELLDTATESLLTGARQPIGTSLRRWFENVLGLSPASAGWTMDDAQRGLDWIVSKEGGYFSTPVGLEPLLQSVDRFFTVPPASDAAAPGSGPSQAPVTPARPQPAVREQTSVKPAPPSGPTPTVMIAAARAPKRQVIEPADERAPMSNPSTPRASSPVSAAPVASATPPAPAMPAARPEPPFSARAPELAADPLLATSSPLAEFAAERATDPIPAAPEMAASAPSLRPLPPPRPMVPSPAEADAPEVGPVADMLSAGGRRSTRRSGWNDEAWMSRSGDKPASRPSAPGSGAVPKALSGPTAPTLKPREVVATVSVPDPVVSAGVPAKPAAGNPGSHPTRSAPPSASRPVAAPRPSGENAAVSASSRSLFGASGQEDAREDEGTAGGGKMKWIAIAAALILCAGGFAGWSLLRPSQPAVKAAPAETAKPATPPPTAEPNAAQPASGTPDTAAAPAAAPAATPAPSEPAPNGFAQIVAAIPVRVAERGESLGASTGPLSMAPGRHVLELSNDEVGYRSTVVVDVRSGRTTRVSVALPRGSVNINATPWAEVFVDGQRLGETPLGNLQLTVGAHEVRFRHPQLGEQVRTVVITTGAPGRLSVDMKK